MMAIITLDNKLSLAVLLCYPCTATVVFLLNSLGFGLVEHLVILPIVGDQTPLVQ